MLVVMRHDASQEDVRRVVTTIEEMGYEARPMPGRQRTTVGLVGNDGRVDGARVQALPGVAEVIYVTKPYKQVSREWKPESTVIRLANGITIGGPEAAAEAVRAAGATILRGGAFKPRSSPYSFQGLGSEALRLLAKVREATGLLIVTEAMDPDQVEEVADVADIVQVGARNMQNYTLLRRVGRCGKPVLLKRGMAATVQDLLLSAEYILAEGNPDVILCERGLRGFDTVTRNLFDVTAIPVVHHLSHLPIVADPSHGTGRRDLVPAMARASMAAGADGLIVEVHPEPERALSDGAQSLDPTQFATMMQELVRVAEAIGRSVTMPVGAPK
jgi:3-deoxy-7-phosphoheptulonate synthase